MGCYFIKETCSCVIVEAGDPKFEVAKSSSPRKSSPSSPHSSEHNIWKNTPNLQKEFAHSISKAVLSNSSKDSSSSENKKEVLTIRTEQITLELKEADSKAETKKKKMKFVRSLTTGQ